MKAALRWALVALIATGTALPAAAQWKWRDGSGRLQYSDRPPPPGVSEKDILSRPSPNAQPAAAAAAPATAGAAAAGAASTAASAVAARASAAATAASAASAARFDPVIESRRREAERAEAAKQKAEADKLAAARADNCQRARTQLRTIEDGMRLSRVNAQGEREILDDKARLAEAERARGIIATECR